MRSVGSPSGTGLQTRKLFTNDEQTLIEACRGVAFNGIPDVAARGDFADRSVTLTVEAIADDLRLEEEVLEEKFLAAHPTILGALLDGVVAGLRGHAAARAAMKRKPRMADFAVFAAAAAPAFGWTAEQFLEAYEANRKKPGPSGWSRPTWLPRRSAGWWKSGGQLAGRVRQPSSSRSSTRRCPKPPGGNGSGRRAQARCRTGCGAPHLACAVSGSPSRKNIRAIEKSTSAKRRSCRPIVNIPNRLGRAALVRTPPDLDATPPDFGRHERRFADLEGR
jgi:hypothetical protein